MCRERYLRSKGTMYLVLTIRVVSCRNLYDFSVAIGGWGPFHELCPVDSYFFFCLPKRKSTKKKRAPLSPIAPRGQGSAIRCYPSALLNCMALIFLPITVINELRYKSRATSPFLSFSEHIYGNKKAPSCAQLYLYHHLCFGVYMANQVHQLVWPSAGLMRHFKHFYHLFF